LSNNKEIQPILVFIVGKAGISQPLAEEGEIRPIQRQWLQSVTTYRAHFTCYLLELVVIKIVQQNWL
jgi:hypothetical protein